MYTDNASTAIAHAQYPNGGRPGSYIEINTSYNHIVSSKKVFAMTHEFGHNFGLDHTNNGYRIIDCTPNEDENSVMNSVVSEWTKFSFYDNVAISTLYPVAQGAKKIYRYRKNNYYLYTTNPCEIAPGKDGYLFDGDVGYLYSTQVSGTVPLYRSAQGNAINKWHKLSTSKPLIGGDLLGYLCLNKEPGTTALYCIRNMQQEDMYSTKKEPALLVFTYGYVLHKFLSNEKDDIIFR